MSGLHHVTAIAGNALRNLDFYTRTLGLRLVKRTVNFDDVTTNSGAPNIDSECTGTTLRDYLRATDLSRLPDEVVAPYDTEPLPEDAVLVYGANISK